MQRVNFDRQFQNRYLLLNDEKSVQLIGAQSILRLENIVNGIASDSLQGRPCQNGPQARPCSRRVDVRLDSPYAVMTRRAAVSTSRLSIKGSHASSVHLREVSVLLSVEHRAVVFHGLVSEGSLSLSLEPIAPAGVVGFSLLSENFRPTRRPAHQTRSLNQLSISRNATICSETNDSFKQQ